MWIVYHFNQTVAALSTLAGAERIARKLSGNVKVIYERVAKN
jgi:hypothetical protein